MMAGNSLRRRRYAKTPSFVLEIRTLLAAGAGLVAMHRDVANQIRGALKTFGLVLGKVAAATFEARVRQLVDGNPLLVEVIEALLKVWRTTGEQLVSLHRRVLLHAQRPAAA